jgi:mannose-6-phosphate isomerase
MILRPLPVLHRPPWGGLCLANLYGKDQRDTHIGESWEVWGASLLPDGRTVREVCGFTLLIKLIDVEDQLSVQVHPDDTQAMKLEGRPEGKAEAWYIIGTRPAAKVALGLKRDLGAAELRALADTGAIEAELRWTGVHAGEVIDIPPGTIHSLGGGVLLYEVQQPSELTYRFYDWGRARPLHLDKAVAVVRTDSRPVPRRAGEGWQEILIENQHFTLTRLRIDQARVATLAGWEAWTVVAGNLRVGEEEVAAGSTVLVGPGRYPLDGAAQVLVASMPSGGKKQHS